VKSSESGEVCLVSGKSRERSREKEYTKNTVEFKRHRNKQRAPLHFHEFALDWLTAAFCFFFLNFGPSQKQVLVLFLLFSVLFSSSLSHLFFVLLWPQKIATHPSITSYLPVFRGWRGMLYRLDRTKEPAIWIWFVACLQSPTSVAPYQEFVSEKKYVLNFESHRLFQWGSFLWSKMALIGLLCSDLIL